MIRANECEILDQDGVPDHLVDRAYRDLAGIHRWLGDTGAIVRAIQRDPLPVRRVLDVGCATGLVLEHIGRRLGVEVIGVDIHPRASISAPVPILQADAVRDPLPPADVAYCMHVCHHLDERELLYLIRNVGRYCRRLILIDLVRHPLPLALFRLFVTPFLCSIDAEDGKLSIRRSYTPSEFRGIAAAALAGTGSSFCATVSSFRVRQMIDISYAGGLPADELAQVGELSEVNE